MPRTNSLKSAVAAIAFSKFREGVTIEGAESYDILKPDTGAVLVLSVKATPDRPSRYFTVKVSEMY